MNRENPSTGLADLVAEGAYSQLGCRFRLDGRRPLPLDCPGEAYEIVAGHADLFAVIGVEGDGFGARHHLFRVERGRFLFGFAAPEGISTGPIQVIAVGSEEAQAVRVGCAGTEDPAAILDWISRMSALLADRHPSWDIPEIEAHAASMAIGERYRGPARDIVWVRVVMGRTRLMGLGPAYEAGDPPVPLTAGLWIEAGEDGCSILAGRTAPSGQALRAALGRFQACSLGGIRARLESAAAQDVERVVRRSEQGRVKTGALFERLGSLVGRLQPAQARPAQVTAANEDMLFSACELVAAASCIGLRQAESLGVSGASPVATALEIATASRVRARKILLRGAWWRQDSGPLLAWFGESASPMALLPANRGYVAIDPETGRRQRVSAAVAARFSPVAITFYPSLPSRALRPRDLLVFALRHSKGSYGRILLALVAIGLLSWVMPLITQVIVSSIIPRTELDQLAFCAVALAVTAIAMAGVQLFETTAMLRIEGLIDWKLQAAIIDRLLRLPASVFREHVIGDLAARALGIDTIRRIVTGRTMRGMMAGLFCWFSVALMVYFDAKLALVAIGLILIRASVILATCALRYRHETRSIDLQGRVGGLVLQLLSGIGKLRVAAATSRALAVWGEHFTAQKRQFLAAQRLSNGLVVFEGSFAVLATLAIFAAAISLESSLRSDMGAFLAFFAAFGQAMGAIGAWAVGLSDSLIAIPHLKRLAPLMTSTVEVADERKHPGALTGEIELSRITFRYVQSGPPVLDDVSLRVGAGEYIALVGPSGSGKSSLFRLLLGFERPEAGAVFFDGKSIDTLDLGPLRRQFGVVLQNGRLTTGSIYDNICGGAQLSLNQVWEAVRLAGLEADVKAMPMGLHTMIAEGVSTLSGGQEQRIMIARAIARRPRILLFDEATSALDNRSQAVVNEALGNLNVTRLVIAHRLSTVRQVDRIVVLVAGRIVQSGTYESLSRTDGVFADLARRQLL